MGTSWDSSVLGAHMRSAKSPHEVSRQVAWEILPTPTIRSQTRDFRCRKRDSRGRRFEGFRAQRIGFLAKIAHMYLNVSQARSRAWPLQGRFQNHHGFYPYSLRGLSMGFLDLCHFGASGVLAGRMPNKSGKFRISPKRVDSGPKRVDVRPPGAQRALGGKSLHISGPKRHDLGTKTNVAQKHKFGIAEFSKGV